MIQKFFLICSGADLELLQDCPAGERNKYAGIGATVFFTALMASIASAYALYTVFDNVYTAIFFGLVWGLLIFNLDRFIVSTIKKRDSFKREMLQATPRIILAIIIAVVISKPLELKIFEKEIDQVLLEEKNQMTLDNQAQLAQQFSPTITQLEQQISDLKNETATKAAEVNALYETYIAEAEGRKGTEIVGKGPVYKEKREKHDAELAALAELRETNTTKIADLEAQIAGLNQSYDQKVTETQPVIDGVDGLMARINALNKLPLLPSLFIFLLFLAIETAPIIAKLLSSKGPYDYKLEEQESAIKVWAEQRVGERQAVLATDQALSQKIHAEIREEEAVYRHKKQQTEALLKAQADKFHEVQLKSL
jgi:hypothetical protein